MWFYEVNSQNVGPVHENEIPALVSSGVIKAHTRVWKRGAENWVHAIETELQHLFASVSGTGSAPSGSTYNHDLDVAPPKPNETSNGVPKFGKEELKDFVIEKLKKPGWVILLVSTAFCIYQSQVLKKLNRDASAMLAMLNERHSMHHSLQEFADTMFNFVDGNYRAIANTFMDVLGGDTPLKQQFASIVQEMHSAYTLLRWAALIGLLSLIWIIFWDLPEDMKKDNDALKKARESQDKLS